MDNEIQEIKKIIINLTKDFHYNEKQINFLTLAYLGIVMLDSDIGDMLEEVLRKTYICFSNASNYTKDISRFFPGLSEDTLNSLSITKGLAVNKQIFNNEVSEWPIIFVKDSGILKTLEVLIHELKHHINEVLAPAQDDYGLTYFYSGLTKSYEYVKDFSMIDEAFNSYITKIFLNNIESLKSLSITDAGIQEILEKCNLKDHPYPPHYDIYIEYCLPLFESPELFRLFYNATIYKDNSPLYASLNDILSPYTYKDFFNALDEKNEEKIKNILKGINHQKLNNTSNKKRN